MDTTISMVLSTSFATLLGTCKATIKLLINYEKSRPGSETFQGGSSTTITETTRWRLPLLESYHTTDQASSSMMTRSDALILDSDNLVSIHEPKEKLISWLLKSNPRRKVMSVIGMGGLGKTTLVKQVNCSVQSGNRFLLAESCDQAISVTKEPSDDTTRNFDVAYASCIESDDMVFNIELLSPDDSWDLFCKRRFKRSTCPAYLVEVSRWILEKCEGLPLAIVAISGLLATKRGTPAEWETIYRSLGPIIKDNDKLMNLTEVLDLKTAPSKRFPGEIVNLFLLRHLSLRETGVKTIPRSIGKLRNLQTLDLKHTYVTELLVEILKLQQLRHLLLTNLQALSVVSSVKDEVIELNDPSSPSQLLQRLFLTGRLEQLPEWIPHLQSMAIVYLKWSRLENLLVVFVKAVETILASRHVTESLSLRSYLPPPI
ncbi:hypothetical protein PTKIN_Ptkin04bG0235800 [Pterospermum kingtungense]